MTDKTTAPKSALKQEVLDLSKKIAEGITLDKKTGHGEAADGLYESNLPEGLTVEAVKAVSDYNTTFVAAGTHAFGTLAVEAMKGSKSLTEATVQIKMFGKDTLGVSVQRSKDYNNSLAKEGEPKTITKHGVITTTYDVVAGNNRGQLKAARNEIAALASEFLSK